MGKIDQLDEGPRLASRFLSYYCFDKEYISYMLDDMMMMEYLHNYDRAKCEKLLNDILQDPVLVEKMKDAIAFDFVAFKELGKVVREATLWSLMPQSKIKENLNKTGYLDRDAIRAWYYHMYPKFTPTEVIKHHQNLLENIGREWYNNLEGWSKNQAQELIDLAYELHDFDFDNKLDDMVKELNGKLLEKIDENVIPQVSMGLLQTRHKERAALLQKIKNKEQKEKEPFSSQLIAENYDYVAKKKFYKKMQVVPEELVVKRLSYKYCTIYSVAEIRAKVRTYYAKRFRYREQQEARANAAEPAIVPQIVVDDDKPVSCSSDLGRHNTIYVPKPVDHVQPNPTVAKEGMTEKRKAQLRQGRKILTEAINVALVTHRNEKGSTNIDEASEKIADIACSMLERRYVLVGPPLGSTKRDVLFESPPPEEDLMQSPTARLNPRWNAPEGVESTEPTKAATQSTPEKVDINLLQEVQEPTETESPTKRLHPRWHPPADTKSPSKAAAAKSPTKYDIKSPHKTSDIKSPPKTADTKPAEPTEKKSPTQPSPRRERLLIPRRTPPKQTETKPSPSRPQPMRRLSSLTPPKATEPDPSPPKSTETRTLASRPHPMRRLSRMTPPKATEPGPSPKSTSSPPKPTDSKSSPKATKRSFISTDKEDSDHQPKKSKLPSDDSDD